MAFECGVAPFSGTQLRRLRRSHGMKQTHLAELVGVGQSTVSKWECGYLLPSTGQHLRLVTLFSTRLDPARDAWLSRLVECSTRQVHVMCDTEHYLLAASRPRIGEWRRDFNEVAAQPLTRLLPPDIAFAENWIVEHDAEAFRLSTLVVRTGGREGGPYDIAPALMLWERFQLSEGKWVRLVTNVSKGEIPEGAIMIN